MIVTISRVSKIAEACLEVSNGDFNVRLADKSNDEIGQMTKAFNSLSSRVQFVLGLVGSFNTAETKRDSFDIFEDESKDFLDTHWQGLMLLNEEREHLDLQRFQDVENTKKWPVTALNLNQKSGFSQDVKQASDSKDIFYIDQLDNYIARHANARVLRDMMRNTMCHSAVAVPLNCEIRGWVGDLILGHKEKYGFDKHRLTLLKNLAPLIAKGFLNKA